MYFFEEWAVPGSKMARILLLLILLSKVLLAATNLHDACMNLDIENVKKFLEDKNTSINAYDIDGYTALGRVIQAPRNEKSDTIVDLLLSDSRINPEMGSRKRESALFMAVKYTNLFAFQKILEEHNVNVNWKNLDGQYCTPLLQAIHNLATDDATKKGESKKMVRRLLKHRKINVNIGCGNFLPLLEIVKFGKPSLLKTFLKNPIWDINFNDQNGDGILHIAFKFMRIDMMSHLFANRSLNFNMTDKDGNTVLHLASERLDNPVVFQFLKDSMENLKFSLNIRNRKNELPFHVFLKTMINNPSISTDFLSVFISTLMGRQDFLAYNAEDQDGNTILHLFILCMLSRPKTRAIASRHLDRIFTVFYGHNFDFNCQNINGETIFHLIMDSVRSKAMYKALEALLCFPGIDPNLTDKNGYTPLQVASKCSNENIFAKILSLSSNESLILKMLKNSKENVPVESPEVKLSNNGYLNQAISKGWHKVSERLLVDEHFGYSEELVESSKIFLQTAVKSKSLECFQLIWLICQKNFKYQPVDDKGKFLKYVASSGIQEIFDIFENLGYDMQGPDGNTKVHWAARHGWIGELERNENLIKVNMENTAGQTLLYMALKLNDREKQTEVVKFLFREPKKIEVCSLLEAKKLPLDLYINEFSGLIVDIAIECYSKQWNTLSVTQKVSVATDIENLRIPLFLVMPLGSSIKFQNLYSLMSSEEEYFRESANLRQNLFTYSVTDHLVGQNELKIKIDRKYMVSSAKLELRRLEMEGKDLSMHPVVIEFIGEKGQDEGALSHEFFFNISKHLFNLPLFQQKNYINIAPLEENKVTEEILEDYRFFGKIMGLAIRKKSTLSEPLAKVLLRLVRGLPETWLDIREVDPKQYEDLMVNFM